MRPITLPEVAYGATAVRKQWSDLPESLRETITARLGSPVVAARSAGGGFTSALATTIETAAGDRVFLKAAPLKSHNSLAYARESAITQSLPLAIAAARPLWTMVDSDWFVLCLPAVDGHVPALPWDPAELRAALGAWSAAAAELAHPGPELLAVGIPALTDVLRTEMSHWAEIATGREPCPLPLPPATIADLAALERDAPALAAGTGMLHGDLRVDNVLITPDGAAVICDWTWPTLGAPWFDAVTLLITAYASGVDADSHLAPWSPPAGGVDGVLAALAGYWLVRAADPAGGGSPHIRQHHGFSGTQALAWLAERRGWRLTFRR
jgi:hypothetical protein